MFQKVNPSMGCRSQKGAALIVALVVLAAVTLIGVSNMQSSGFGMKATTATLIRSSTFAVAEAALRSVEQQVDSGALFGAADLQTDVCASNSPARCFTNNCAEGRCFEGSYLSTSTDVRACDVVPAGGVARTVFWRDPDVWDTAGRHATVLVNGNEAVKYIIEFLCFIDDGTGSIYGSSGAGGALGATGDPLFRITVLAESDNTDIPVMLQSTYSMQI